MANTFWDMGRRSGAESWRRLRQMRSASFISGQDSDLKDTLSMSLQQAEQQFAAAKVVGYESRPLNLFYGLSQAGRAIAVAAKIMGAGGPPMLSGHGIKCTNFPELSIDPIGRFGQLRIRSFGQDHTSFKRLSRLLKSDPLSEETELSTLWGMLVEPHMQEPLSATKLSFIHAGYYPGRDEPTSDRLRLESVPSEIDIENPEEFGAFISRYPTLAGCQLLRAHPLDNGSVRPRPTRTIDISLADVSPHNLERICTVYRNTSVVYPAPYTNASTLHPLMAWWAVLFALSMLARYEPRTWTRLVDVDASPHAIAIEFLLDVAQDSVPDILAEILEGLVMSSL